ncbi:MAG: hypothetical protein ACRD96_27285, partial [Bryobacteraceae bacterium]
IQYGSTVEEIVEHLGFRNNGLYTNEWLIGDAKTNQIAMFELGTHKTKLYRSSRNEWFGGTEGFYWGCNNAKDLNVRLEYAPDPQGRPAHLPFVPSDRDIKWQALYDTWKGRIDEQFGFLAFRTAPLVSATSMDAKITTAEMASRLMMWAVFGKPNQREWVPTRWETENFPHITGIYSSGYRLFQAESVAPKGQSRSAEPEKIEDPKKSPYTDKLWKGWILPATDADVWLTAGSAAYYAALSSDEPEKAVDSHRASFRAAALVEDRPLSKIAADIRSRQGHRLAANKGVLLLDALRREMGDADFLSLMTRFFERNTTKPVAAADFLKEAGRPMQMWIDDAGLPDSSTGPAYVASHLTERLGNALLVYGTVADAGANRRAAELLQLKFLDWHESLTPIRKDFEVSEAEMRSRDVVFVGRPETNSALAGMGLDFEGAAFRIDGADHSSESEALLLAGANPLDRKRMVLVVAGNSALETVRLASAAPLDQWEYAIYDAGKRKAYGFRKR